MKPLPYRGCNHDFIYVGIGERNELVYRCSRCDVERHRDSNHNSDTTPIGGKQAENPILYIIQGTMKARKIA